MLQPVAGRLGPAVELLPLNGGQDRALALFDLSAEVKMRQLRNRRDQLKVRGVEIILQDGLRQLIYPLIVFRYLGIAIRPGMESIKVIENFDNGFFVRREIHRLFGLGTDHDEPQDFGRQEIRHLPRRNAQPLGRTHLGGRRPEKTRTGY